jgi:hypothetical protein
VKATSFPGCWRWLLAIILICRVSNIAAQSDTPATAGCPKELSLRDLAFGLGSAPFRSFYSPAVDRLDNPHASGLPAGGDNHRSSATLRHAPFSQDEREFFAVERFAREGTLRAPPAESPLQRAFEPAVIHLGHAEMTCSVLTAIKRKNPFCLLSPKILRIDF